MCKKCNIDYPPTSEYYTTRKGKVMKHMCRTCHNELLKRRYDEKKAKGYRMRLIKVEEKKEEPKDEKKE